MFTETKKLILDTLFPITCRDCGQAEIWLCPDCQNKLELLKFQVCPFCEKIITEGGSSCQDCLRKKNSLSRLAVATKYKERNLDKIIHLFKYRFISELSDPLGRILVKSLIYNNCPLPDLIIPVPLHPRRLRWRGFNQSELLADFIGENLTPGFPIPVLKNILIRKKYTSPQMQIKNYRARRENIKDAFVVQNGQEIIGKNVLLIDDIATTGSTLFECARVLKESGAKKIYGAVIARQESQKQALS